MLWAAPGGILMRIIAVASVVALATTAVAMGVANQANFNDGRPGSPMQCRTFEDDPQGTKCARWCQEMKDADKDGQPYCMCLPGRCPKAG